MRADETGTRTRFNAHLHELIEPTIANRNGRIVKTTGDGLLVEIASIVDAVQCAVEIQKGIAERNVDEPDDRRMEFRIGVNLGDVIIEGDDIHGDGVNVAARLETLADPGGVCISDVVQQSVADKLNLAFEDLGDQEVKNITKPVRAYRVTLDGASAAPITAPLLLPDKPSIAVLPFDNMSGDPEQEYFSDGLTEDIITALSLWRSFPVISRNSTFTYKGKAVRVQQVFDELGARYVLEGGVRKAGRKVRITAQLIDARSGHHVWAQKFDRDLEDIFAVQDEITERIATTVVPELEKIETKRSATKQPRNLDAWDCYLRGLSFLYGSTKDGNVQAREMFERALELDRSYGPAYTGMAYVLNRDLMLDIAHSFDDTAKRCLEMAERAVALDEASSVARTTLVRALLWLNQYDTAFEEAKRAVELNPFDAQANIWVGVALALAGRQEEGISRLESALEFVPTDPRTYLFTTVLALAYLTTGQLNPALAKAQAAARVVAHSQSDFIEAPLALASVLAHLGEEKKARVVLDQIAVADLRSVERRTFWRRYKYPETKELVLDGLRKAGLPK
jgi:adenylate cyclase